MIMNPKLLIVEDDQEIQLANEFGSLPAVRRADGRGPSDCSGYFCGSTPISCVA